MLLYAVRRHVQLNAFLRTGDTERVERQVYCVQFAENMQKKMFLGVSPLKQAQQDWRCHGTFFESRMVRADML